VWQTPRGALVRVRTGGPIDTAGLAGRLAASLARAGVVDPEVAVGAFERQASGKLKRFFPL
jgi:hypothetical protein